MLKFWKVIFLGIIFLALPLFVSADSLGQRTKFFIDSSYDLSGRDEISATLRITTLKLYFYIDDDWWKDLDYQEKQETESSLRALDNEFYYKIYPQLTSTFGFEWKPGIDNDEKITVLIHPMRKQAGGYFNSGDEYSKLENPESNEREMVYFNAEHVNSFLAKSFFSHEFVHLITFNQKDKIWGVTEEVWLNEARAEYAPTLLGYDANFEGSNLENRVKSFLSGPSDSITEWQGEEADYGALNLFTQYLVEKYGIEILVNSLKSKETGIKSLNTALKNNGFEEDFSQIFTNWLITVYLNNCNLSEKYCYQNKNLKGIRVTPSLIFLPVTGESTLVSTYPIKEWAGNWYKIIGGKDGLKLEFAGSSDVKFKVSYLLQDSKGNTSIHFLSLSDSRKGEIYIPDFREKELSLVLIPSIQSKISDFSEKEPFYTFSLKISVVKSEEEGELELIKELLSQIDFLKKEIARVQAQINAILAERGQSLSCGKFERDLYFGLREDFDVLCLQKFLKSQGSEIYPEGLVTGNFLSLTEVAVIRFQEKYARDILTPLGLDKGTGFVGEMTRTKINQLLGQ
jgi:hypothetical protein